MHPLLESTCAQIRSHIHDADRRDDTVSRWSVGMHIEHCGMVMSKVCDTLSASVASDGSIAASPRVRWSVPRGYVMLMQGIPRGKGTAPEAVIPGESPSVERLSAILDATEKELATLDTLPADAWFDHPVFSVLRRDRTAWFMGVHNTHHLKIIRDILA